jgi:hypothetical protein
MNGIAGGSLHAFSIFKGTLSPVGCHAEMKNTFARLNRPSAYFLLLVKKLTQYLRAYLCVWVQIPAMNIGSWSGLKNHPFFQTDLIRILATSHLSQEILIRVTPAHNSILSCYSDPDPGNDYIS